MKSNSDSLKKRYGIKLFANIFSSIIGVILVAIVPKALGPIDYGYFTYLQNFFMKIVNFLDMGTSTAFFVKLSARHDRKELITFYFLYVVAILFALFLVIFSFESFGYTELLLPSIPDEYIYMGLIFGFFTWLVRVYIKISDAYALTVSVELIKIIHKSISLFLLLYFVYFATFDLSLYFDYQYISLVSFLVILSWLYAKKSIFDQSFFSLNFQFKNILIEFIEYCHPMVVQNIVVLIVGFLDIWLLQKYGGSIETGFYGLAYSLASMSFLFASALTPIITREFAKFYEERDLAKMRKLFYRYIPMLYGIVAYFSIFVSCQSENILYIFTDDKFIDAYSVLVVMAFYPIHQTYGQLSGSLFYATGQTVLMRNIAFATTFLGLIVSFVLLYILDLGAMGLAYKMVFVQLIGVNIQLYFNSKFLKLNILYFLKHQLYVVILFVVLAFISSNLFDFERPIVNFLSSGVVYTLLVIIFTYIYPDIFATTREEISKTIKGIKGYASKSTIADEG